MTTVNKSRHEQRIVSLNIRHCGGTVARVDALIARLLGYEADVVVVTEFRANRFGAHLIGELQRAGYATSRPGLEVSRNAVLIASRGSIDRAWAFSDELDARHLWCADVGGIVVCGVCMPQKTEKLPYWEALIAHGLKTGVDLCIGDFNTGDNDLDKGPKGARFVGHRLAQRVRQVFTRRRERGDRPEMPGRLIESGYADVWRSRHPGIREYSWFSPGAANNGFRIDHAYAAPELTQRVTACEFDQTPRLLRETDHAALIVSLMCF